MKAEKNLVVDPETHRAVKTAASARGESLKQYTTKALRERMERDERRREGRQR